jgi:hypothetical protein
VPRIVLTIPREREFSAVADLVLAGLASRLDLTLETIDDFQLALETLLERNEGAGELTVQLDYAAGMLEASVGPFDRDEIEPALAQGDDAGIGLRRLLTTTVDTFELAERDGVCWIDLRKAVSV